MREILFRGKDISGEWHYGVPLIFTEDYVCIAQSHSYNKKVEFETLGQYTGLTDKNGNKIFEGDILKERGDNAIYIVCWINAGFEIKDIDLNYCYLLEMGADKEVIGNIYDNPELLKECESD